MNTNAQVMAWVMDEYSKIHGFSPAVVTGKPLDLHGSEGREAATGRGVVFVAEEFLKDCGSTLEGANIAVQGFGNVGWFVSILAHQLGARIVAVSDASGGIAHLRRASTYQGWRNSRGCAVHFRNMMRDHVSHISNEEVLVTPADILVPAALGGVLTPEVARNLRAKAVIEAANAPTDPEADEILNERGIPVIPDILANAGGVTASYFEWAQNIQCLRWTEEEVNHRLKHIMTSSYATVRKLKKHRNLTWRTAAFIVALGRVAKATVLRGI